MNAQNQINLLKKIHSELNPRDTRYRSRFMTAIKALEGVQNQNPPCQCAKVKEVIENLMDQYRGELNYINMVRGVSNVDWNRDTYLPSYEAARELLKKLDETRCACNERQQDWVRVDSGVLPVTINEDESTDVLVFPGYKRCYYGKFLDYSTDEYKIGFYFYDELRDGYVEIKNVTHWMKRPKLPDPPQQ